MHQALLKRGGDHASSTSTTAQPFTHTTWKTSPPPWIPALVHQVSASPRLQGRYPSGYQ
ncbi:hypothetical protein DFAR_2730042 [Desulfarculales bacterium]